jgi:hypothetical protein
MTERLLRPTSSRIWRPLIALDYAATWPAREALWSQEAADSIASLGVPSWKPYDDTRSLSVVLDLDSAARVLDSCFDKSEANPGMTILRTEVDVENLVPVAHLDASAEVPDLPTVVARAL